MVETTKPTHDEFTKKPHRAFPVTRHGIPATNAWCWACGYFPLPLEGSVQLGPDAPGTMPASLRSTSRDSEVREAIGKVIRIAEDAASCPYGGHLSGCDHRPDLEGAIAAYRAILDRSSEADPTPGHEALTAALTEAFSRVEINGSPVWFVQRPLGGTFMDGSLTPEGDLADGEADYAAAVAAYVLTRPPASEAAPVVGHSCARCGADHLAAKAAPFSEAWAKAETAHRAIQSSGFPLSVTSNEPLHPGYTAAAGMADAPGDTPAEALLNLAARLTQTRTLGEP